MFMCRFNYLYLSILFDINKYVVNVKKSKVINNGNIITEIGNLLFVETKKVETGETLYQKLFFSINYCL